MKPTTVALLTWLLPTVAVHLTYLISAVTGKVPWCIPYLEGCTSISRASRQEPAIYVFRALIFPAAVFMMLYWRHAREWLTALGDGDSRITRALPYLGFVACSFLILYATFLGSQGETYQLLRRYGIALHFGISGVTQLLMLERIYRLRIAGVTFPDHNPQFLLAWCMGMCVVGVANVPISHFDLGDLQDAVEWMFVLFMYSYFCATWVAWHKLDLRTRFTIGGA